MRPAEASALFTAASLVPDLFNMRAAAGADKNGLLGTGGFPYKYSSSFGLLTTWASHEELRN